MELGASKAHALRNASDSSVLPVQAETQNHLASRGLEFPDAPSKYRSRERRPIPTTISRAAPPRAHSENMHPSCAHLRNNLFPSIHFPSYPSNANARHFNICGGQRL